MLLNFACKRATRGLLGGVRDVQAVRRWRGERAQPSLRKSGLTYTSCCKEGFCSNQKYICVFLVPWLSSNGSVICPRSQVRLVICSTDVQVRHTSSTCVTGCQECTNLHSLVRCLDHRDPDTERSHARLCQAAQCIGMHLGACANSHGEYSH